ncbi:unnamed protein product [Rhizophagus irregularis]|nr:unnamed protein product [Rhizophagus irregularis]
MKLSFNSFCSFGTGLRSFRSTRMYSMNLGNGTLVASEVFLSDPGIFSGIRVINNSQSDRIDLPSHTTTLDK